MACLQLRLQGGMDSVLEGLPSLDRRGEALADCGPIVGGEPYSLVQLCSQMDEIVWSYRRFWIALSLAL
jgi:hypothetical protein